MKLRKKVIEEGKAEVTDYLDGYQYVDEVLEFYPHAEGYVNMKSGTPEYVYNYTDHLGNVRVSYVSEDGTAQIVEESNYYPFGLRHKGYNNVIDPIAEKYKYGYNGKELQDELGLNTVGLDYRQYNPDLGRFMSVDALAEFAPTLTPYRYAFNSPIVWNDPTGLYESRKEARKIRRENRKDEEGRFTGRIRKVKGEYVITDRSGKNATDGKGNFIAMNGHKPVDMNFGQALGNDFRNLLSNFSFSGNNSEDFPNLVGGKMRRENGGGPYRAGDTVTPVDLSILTDFGRDPIPDPNDITPFLGDVFGLLTLESEKNKLKIEMVERNATYRIMDVSGNEKDTTVFWKYQTKPFKKGTFDSAYRSVVYPVMQLDLDRSYNSKVNDKYKIDVYKK